MSTDFIASQVALEDIATSDLDAFVAYWRSLRGERFAPSWREFDLLALDTDSISRIVVADVQRNPLDFVVRFWGTGHVRKKGVDKTGESINQPPNIRKDRAHAEYRWVIENKAPLASRDIVDLQHVGHRAPFHQSLLRLPLSDDGIDVHNVISLAVWERV